MTKHTQLMIGMFVAGVIIGIGIISGNSADAPTTLVSMADPRNSTYVIDGQDYVLVDGKAEVSQFPDAVSVVSVALWGDPVVADVDHDGDRDLVQVLTYNGGGSGTFYYLSGLITGQNVLTSAVPAVLLGDRIAMQGVVADELGIVTVRYAERHDDEPMTVAPSVGVTKRFVFDSGVFQEIPQE